MKIFGELNVSFMRAAAVLSSRRGRSHPEVCPTAMPVDDIAHVTHTRGQGCGQGIHLLQAATCRRSCSATANDPVKPFESATGVAGPAFLSVRSAAFHICL